MNSQKNSWPNRWISFFVKGCLWHYTDPLDVILAICLYGILLNFYVLVFTVFWPRAGVILNLDTFHSRDPMDLQIYILASSCDSRISRICLIARSYGSLFLNINFLKVDFLKVKGPVDLDFCIFRFFKRCQHMVYL